LVYLSPIAWSSFDQRPHKFVQWYHNRSGKDVIWLDPYPTRLPKLNDIKRLFPTPSSSAPKIIPDWLTVIKPKALPIEPLPLVSKINNLFWFKITKKLLSISEPPVYVFGKPSAMAKKLLVKFPKDTISLYDAMDDFPTFQSGLSQNYLTKMELDLARTVGLVIVSSSGLLVKFKNLKINPIVALNGCDVSALPPLDALPPKPPAPVVGYIGTIGSWFDWPLVINLAKRHPMVTWRLVGPVVGNIPDLLPSNIEILPQCSHEKAIEHMRGFSAGLIPFKITPLTKAVDPIKYYEYYCLGLPILSTIFGEMIYRDRMPGVFLINHLRDVEGPMNKAFRYSPDLKQIATFREYNDWNKRFDLLWDYMTGL
jgi:hypothetical protein